MEFTVDSFRGSEAPFSSMLTIDVGIKSSGCALMNSRGELFSYAFEYDTKVKSLDFLEILQLCYRNSDYYFFLASLFNPPKETCVVLENSFLSGYYSTQILCLVATFLTLYRHKLGKVVLVNPAYKAKYLRNEGLTNKDKLIIDYVYNLIGDHIGIPRKFISIHLAEAYLLQFVINNKKFQYLSNNKVPFVKIKERVRRF